MEYPDEPQEVATVIISMSGLQCRLIISFLVVDGLADHFMDCAIVILGSLGRSGTVAIWLELSLQYADAQQVERVLAPDLRTRYGALGALLVPYTLWSTAG